MIMSVRQVGSSDMLCPTKIFIWFLIFSNNISVWWNFIPSIFSFKLPDIITPSVLEHTSLALSGLPCYYYVHLSILYVPCPVHLHFSYSWVVFLLRDFISLTYESFYKCPRHFYMSILGQSSCWPVLWKCLL